MRSDPQYARLARFYLVGLIAATLQLLLLRLLTACFPLHAAIPTPLAGEIIVLHNFIWHQRFT